MRCMNSVYKVVVSSRHTVGKGRGPLSDSLDLSAPSTAGAVVCTRLLPAAPSDLASASLLVVRAKSACFTSVDLPPLASASRRLALGQTPLRCCFSLSSLSQAHEDSYFDANSAPSPFTSNIARFSFVSLFGEEWRSRKCKEVVNWGNEDKRRSRLSVFSSWQLSVLGEKGDVAVAGVAVP
ncbi:hypothetical protein AAHA92_10657 [Salvia divinorum]|uniref:Uncharacterized protein n=1 Tax=Salvia divinorum TaxID=28513 RepID=A0ABD1HVE4_SALDI